MYIPKIWKKHVRRQPGVRDCVVIGLERDGNAEPCAVLLMDGAGSNPESAVQNANRSLAEYQQIRHWFPWPDADFPRTPTLKPLLSPIREFVNAKIGVTSPSDDGESVLAALITKITGRPVASGSRNAGLEADLKLTSLDRVELMSALEDRYQTELNEVRFSESGSIAQLEKLLTETRAASVEHAYPRWPQSWLATALRLAVYYLLAWPATYLLAAPRVRGRENLRGLHGPVLVISNHVTYLDIAWILPALPARFRNRLATAMGGERLARMRRPPKEMNMFGRLHERLDYFLVLSLFNVFPLPQTVWLPEEFFVCRRSRGSWLEYPSVSGGTDDRRRKHCSFQSGIGLLAKQLNIPVVPVRLEGLYDLKQQNRILARPGHVKVVIGQPIRFSPDQDANEITRELERRVTEL